jgi:hypothetical protein
MNRAFLLLLLAPIGCQSEPLLDGREHIVVTANLTIGPDGRSEPYRFRVFGDARSITVVARGTADRLYALASLVDAAGIERVQLDAATPLGDSMQRQFVDEQVAFMPGELVQTVRLGEFTHVFPYAPSQPFPPGMWEVRVACDRPGDRVEVSVDNTIDDGGRTVHVNLLTVTDGGNLAAAGEALAAASAILAQVGVVLIVDEQRSLVGTPFSKLDETFPTLPGPMSELAQLARLGRQQVTSTGLNVFVVDAFAAPLVRGASLGLPGHADPASYYFGVFVRNDPDPVRRARTMAHEIAHFLGLQHVENVSASRKIYPDAYDDTMTGAGNLMDAGDGTALSGGQAFALSRSPLLRTH